MDPQAILRFWFDELQPEQWWRVDPALDAEMRRRFEPTQESARRAELYGWRAQPEGRLAEVIVLDQFSRNIHRGTPVAFAQDPLALALAQEALAAGAVAALAPEQRCFALMPFMHSESRLIHVWADQLFRQYAPENHPFELRHKAIIDRFARYPHRNAILGRASTVEELAFLGQPGSSF